MTNAGRGIEIRRVGVISIGPKESVREPLEYLRKKSSELSVEVLEIETSDITEDNLEIDFAIALGGDGTMLQALRYFLGTSIPVIGINFGRIGFLTSISRNEFRDGLDQVFLGVERKGHRFPVRSPLRLCSDYSSNHVSLYR